METINKPKIDSIYPLSFLQQGLLFHSISNKVDQGLLIVEAKLRGTIDPKFLEAALNMVVHRHQVMRTTVHWENLEKPLQIVHQNKSMNFCYLDWKNNAKEKQIKDLEFLKDQCLIKGSGLNKGPLLDFYLIATKKDCYELVWPVHHLLLDGWSSSIILNDVLINYEALSSKISPVFEALPTHKSYLKWSSNKNTDEAKDFWKLYFKNFREPILFNHRRRNLNPDPPIKRTLQLSNEMTSGLQDFSRSTKVTLSTLLQGIWSMTLFRFFNCNDIVHGTTVSGRSADFPNIHLIAGMYMNVQPVRNRISSNEQLISEWFKDLQERQQQASKYEYLGLDQLLSFLEQPLNNKLFDSLFIYENYPMVDSNNSSIYISDFKSGLTTNFPVTMVAIPGESLQFTLSAAFEVLNETAAEWLINSFRIIIENLIIKKLITFSDLFLLITVYERDDQNHNKINKNLTRAYSPPTNKLESQLIGLWEHVLGEPNVGINDNFFDLGGDSLNAVQIITKANKLGIKIAPNQLFKHQSIAELSNALMAYEKPQEKYNHLVEIKPTGNKAPLFCLHADGSHVFSYNRLANHIDLERPIYMLRSFPLNEKLKFHKSIEEMANDFAHEIQEIQPKGPYHIMVYCWSTAVGLEVANLLFEKGEHINFLVVDTMADVAFSHPYVSKFYAYMTAIRNESLAALFKRVRKRVKGIVKPKRTGYNDNIEEIKTERLRYKYKKIYTSYHWKPVLGNISLILTYKAETKWHSDIINSWRKLSNDKLEIIYMEGEHGTLFTEPDVKKMANVLEQCMQEFEKTSE